MATIAGFAAHAWLPGGFADDVGIQSDSLGALTSIGEQGGDARRLGRYVLPGMSNLHSHAFQRAMAGLAERQSNPDDSFWTWREVMYAFAGRIGPEELHAIAAQLYVEMLKAGYTQVCEFHYLHHQPDGSAYAEPAAMSLALVEAARETGIGLTLLPTLYMTGGFDGRPLSERQRRFRYDVDGYLRLLERLRKLESPLVRVGVALHSLRAVPEAAMRSVLDSGLVRDCPIHIHVAEQIGEVQDSLSLRNARPVEWLLDHAPVDRRWCLVHATHLADAEMRRLAASGAVAGLCPTTEANLGDGLFPLKSYLDAGGRIGIGSDSHISVSVVEELRWLEYGQRLATRRRNVSASRASPDTGETLFRAALAGGAQAAGVAVSALAEGSRADLVILDENAPLLAGRDAAHLLDTWVFAGNANLIRSVIVAGDTVVADFRHRDEERIAQRYRSVVERLAKSA
ncbi:MAG TPA: formimidoylglutamate deiminase [Rhodanobacteraceae bacterium]|nr:formimidoylglutamate deiminase [Rhodanobacteraceae bacterium]